MHKLASHPVFLVACSWFSIKLKGAVEVKSKCPMHSPTPQYLWNAPMWNFSTNQISINILFSCLCDTIEFGDFISFVQDDSWSWMVRSISTEAGNVTSLIFKSVKKSQDVSQSTVIKNCQFSFSVFVYFLTFGQNAHQDHSPWMNFSLNF